MEKKNVCPHCGGPLVMEYIGNYGDVYVMRQDGTPGRKRIKRFIYEKANDAPLVYCWKCRRGPDFGE